MPHILYSYTNILQSSEAPPNFDSFNVLFEKINYENTKTNLRMMLGLAEKLGTKGSSCLGAGSL